MVFLDTNILLELLLSNRKQTELVEQYLTDLPEMTAISILTVHLVLHFGRLNKIDDRLLHAGIARHQLLSMQPEDYEWARDYGQGRDFEDALQLAVARRSGCSQLVTLDKSFAQRYKEQSIQVVLLS